MAYRKNVRVYTKVRPPKSIWIDTAGLPTAEARGHESYYLKPYSETDGPSDGQSVEYVQRVDVLREAAALQCRFCALATKYGIAERDPASDLYAHKKNGARFCEANSIQRAITATTT